MIGATDYLCAADQVKALAIMRRVTGREGFMASALREINAMNAYGGIAALRQQTESMFADAFGEHGSLPADG